MPKHISDRDLIVTGAGFDWAANKPRLAVQFVNRPGSWSPYEAAAFAGQSNVVNQSYIVGGDNLLDFSGKDSLDSRLFEISRSRQISDFVAPDAGVIIQLTNQAQDQRQDGKITTNSKLHYGKHRLAWFPSIQRIVFSARAVDNTSILSSGTGILSGQWQANGPTGNGVHLQAAINEMSSFLANNPKYRLTHIVSDIGATDARDGVNAAAFKVAYREMVDEYRGAMRGGSEALWVIQTLPSSLRAVGNGTAIQQAMQDMGTPGHPDYIPNTTWIDTGDLPLIPGDVYHYTYEGVRTLGERIHRAVAEFGTFSKINLLPEYVFQYHEAEGKFVNCRPGFEGVGNIWNQRLIYDPLAIQQKIVLDAASAAGNFLGFDTDWRFDPSQSYTKLVSVMRRDYLNLSHRDPFICGQRMHLDPGDARYQATVFDGHYFGRTLITNLSDTDYWEFTEVPGTTDGAANAPNYYGYWPMVGEGSVDGSNRWVPPSDTRDDFRSKLVWLSFGMTFNAETGQTKLYFNGLPVRSALNVTKIITDIQPGTDPTGAEQIIQILGSGHTNVAGTMRPFSPGNFNGHCRRVVLLNGRAATDIEMVAFALE